MAALRKPGTGAGVVISPDPHEPRTRPGGWLPPVRPSLCRSASASTVASAVLLPVAARLPLRVPPLRKRTRAAQDCAARFFSAARGKPRLPVSLWAEESRHRPPETTPPVQRSAVPTPRAPAAGASARTSSGARALPAAVPGRKGFPPPAQDRKSVV